MRALGGGFEVSPFIVFALRDAAVALGYLLPDRPHLVLTRDEAIPAARVRVAQPPPAYESARSGNIGKWLRLRVTSSAPSRSTVAAIT